MCNQYGRCAEHESLEVNAKRFWSKVKKTDSCWLWTAYHNDKDRPIFCINDERIMAYRFSYELKNGSIPSGLLVCHTCDNGLCVNPDHLWLGTQKDNMQDASKKKRLRNGNKCGEDHSQAKLTWAKVAEIRQSYSPHKIMRKDLAKKYGVCRTTIDRILCGEYWKRPFLTEGEK